MAMTKSFGDDCGYGPSLVYDLLPEFDHHRIAFVSLQYMAYTDPQTVCADFRNWLKDVQKHSPVKVVICGQSEGLVHNSKKFVHTLVNDLNISVCDIVYISSAMPLKLTVRQFQEYLGYPVRILFYTAWQNMVVTNNANLTDWIKKSRVEHVPELKFLNYNGGPRPHRVALLYHLSRMGLLADSLYSAHINPEVDQKQLFQDCLQVTFPDIATVAAEHLAENQIFGKTLDADYHSLKHSENGHSQWYVKTDHHEKTRFSVITETAYCNKRISEKIQEQGLSFDSPTIPCGFATEKTFRAILGRHAFVMISTTGFLSQLREMGYMTFHPYIDESYDLIQDDQERMLAAVEQIHKLCEMDDQSWYAFQQQVEHIIEHNVNMLLDSHHNQHCVKSWILTSDNQPVIIDQEANKTPRNTYETTVD